MIAFVVNQVRGNIKKMVRDNFKILIFLEHLWVATCYCSSTYELNTNIWNIG